VWSSGNALSQLQNTLVCAYFNHNGKFLANIITRNNSISSSSSPGGGGVDCVGFGSVGTV
jgi:hypothetical protein